MCLTRSPRGEPWSPGQPTVWRPGLLCREGRLREGSWQVSWPLRSGCVWRISPHCPLSSSECSWSSGPGSGLPRKVQVHGGVSMDPFPGRIQPSPGLRSASSLLCLCSASWTDSAHSCSRLTQHRGGPRPVAPGVRVCASPSHPVGFHATQGVRLFFSSRLPCLCFLQPQPLEAISRAGDSLPPLVPTLATMQVGRKAFGPWASSRHICLYSLSPSVRLVPKRCSGGPSPWGV